MTGGMSSKSLTTFYFYYSSILHYECAVTSLTQMRRRARHALGALSVTDRSALLSVLLYVVQHSRSAVASMQMRTRGEAIVSPEAQRNIPQLCGRSFYNHRQSGRNVFCLRSYWS